MLTIFPGTQCVTATETIKPMENNNYFSLQYLFKVNIVRISVATKPTLTLLQFLEDFNEMLLAYS